MIEVTYVLTIDDYMDAVRERYRRDPANIRVRVGFIVVGVGLVAVFFEKLPPAYWLIFVGIMLAWWGIRSPAYRLKNYYKKCVTDEQITAQVDEKGVRTESSTGRSESRWPGIAYVLETSKTFSL